MLQSVIVSRFFDYMKEREAIRLRKEADRIALLEFEDPQGPPWTDDPILREYKFTNVRRHHDWTSDMLRSTFYSDHFNDDPKDIIMMCAFARYFGRFEFIEHMGWITYDMWADGWFDAVKDEAQDWINKREKVFTGAYVITNQGIIAPKYEVVVDHFLTDLHAAVPAILDIVQKTSSWEHTARAMSVIKGFGGTGFMTKEILLDTMMTGFWGGDVVTQDERSFTYPSDYWSWTPIGPGGVRGAARLLGHEDPGSARMKKDEPMYVILDLVLQQENYWPKEYGKLSPTDIQFQLCEFDKYERVRLGQGRPRSKYKPR
ncbi:MAG: hypothetical protein Tp138OMZ00d2C19078261_48 [Prokaryotic dsDNA virus sp.]|jgi:hypothetical protein|nr:MAG: hypothetical protein Tp138OMZ00d2C19078261_48 [Prokaryotic dsDNA virus sp.]|tara:strand:- start:34260 stop:35207 length:948 start_codon:yes stop_codon:yes gene_type:complete